jgi:hypothetical protein
MELNRHLRGLLHNWMPDQDPDWHFLHPWIGAVMTMHRYLLAIYFILLSGLAIAQSITGGGGGGSSSSSGTVTGGSCAANQYANAVGTDGAPTCAGVTSGQVSGLTSIATSGSATDLNTGTIPQARLGVAPTAWTPTDGSGAGLSFTGVSANYVRMGNMVFAYAALTYPGTADASNASLQGLPITVANADYAEQCSVSWTNVASLDHMRAIKNTTNIVFYNSTGVGITNATFSGLTVYFMCIYPAT